MKTTQDAQRAIAYISSFDHEWGDYDKYDQAISCLKQFIQEARFKQTPALFKPIKKGN